MLKNKITGIGVLAAALFVTVLMLPALVFAEEKSQTLVNAETAQAAFESEYDASTGKVTWETLIRASRTYDLAKKANDNVDALTTYYQSIKLLDMGGKSITGQAYYGGTDIGSLAIFTELEELDLAETDITSLGALQYMSKLKYLDLSGNEKLDQKGAIAQLTNLEVLNMQSTDFTNYDYGPIVELKKLVLLNLSENDRLTNIGPLKQCTSLKGLSVSWTGLTQLQEVSDFPNVLEILDAQGLRLSTHQAISGLVVMTQRQDFKPDTHTIDIDGAAEYLENGYIWNLDDSVLFTDEDGHVGMVKSKFGSSGSFTEPDVAGGRVSVSFEKGEHGQGVMTPVELYKGEDYKLPDCGFLSADDKYYSFRGWKVEEDVYRPGDILEDVTEDTTATALWYCIDVINVEGKRVRPFNCNDVKNDGGSVKYDPATNTLTLTDATIEMARREDSSSDLTEWGIRFNMNDPYIKTLPFVIKLIGDNKIVDAKEQAGSTAKCGICIFDSMQSITFTGPGTLSIDASADNETVQYGGIQTRKNTAVDGTTIKISIPGTAPTCGYDMHYSNVLTLRNNANLIINTGSNTSTNAIYNYHPNGKKDHEMLSVEEGSVFEAVSENQAISSFRLKSETAALGVMVSANPSIKGYEIWDGTTDLSTYKYIHIPNDHEHTWDGGVVTKEPTITSTGTKLYTCTVCEHTKEEVLPILSVKEALSPGASRAAAESAVTAMIGNKDPAGSKYAPLKLRSKKQTKKSISVSWNKAKGAVKYVLYGNASGQKNKMVKLVETKKTSVIVKKLANKKKLKSKTYYKFILVSLDKNDRVVSTSKVIHAATRGYRRKANPTGVKVQANVTIAGKKTKKFHTKTTIGVKAGKTAQLKATIRKTRSTTVKKYIAIRFESSNSAIAKVTAKGKIQGVKKGNCKVYVYAQNGMYKTVKVAVK